MVRSSATAKSVRDVRESQHLTTWMKEPVLGAGKWEMCAALSARSGRLKGTWKTGFAPIVLTLWKEKTMRAKERVGLALRSIGLDPDDPQLINRLRFTKTGRVRNILGKSFKTMKGEGEGVFTAVAHLSPEKESGYNTCAFATSCPEKCINGTGQMVFEGARIARISRTVFFKMFPDQFFDQLRMEIDRHIWLSKVKGMTPAVRLNGTSDVPWEDYGIVQEYENIQWYDYTKYPLERRNPPPNYHLTFSLSEDPESMDRALEYLAQGRTAAIVVQSVNGNTRGTAVKAAGRLVNKGELFGFPVVSGDEDDIRFWDPPGHWVVLHAKGQATKDTTGFVYRVA